MRRNLNGNGEGWRIFKILRNWSRCSMDFSPQQPLLQWSSSQAVCKRMCLILRLRIRNHLKGLGKKSRKMNCCREAASVQGKGTWKYAGKHMKTSTDYKHSSGRFHVVIFQRGVDTGSWPLLYMMFHHAQCFCASTTPSPCIFGWWGCGPGVPCPSHHE